MRGFLTNVSAAVRAVWLALIAPLVLWAGIAGAMSDALMEQYNQHTALKQQRKYTEAIPFAKRALEIGENEFGPNHLDTAIFANNLGFLYEAQGRYGEAEPLYRRSLAIREKALGREHPDVAASLKNLGFLYEAQGRYGEAEPLYKRSLAIKDKALGLDHPDVAAGLSNLSGIYFYQGRYDKALTETRRATTIHAGRAAHGGEAKSSGGIAEQASVGFMFHAHVRIASRYAKEKPEERSELLAETFRVAQLARATSTGATVSRMGARFAAGSDRLAETVRRRQDTLERWRQVGADLVKAVSAAPIERNSTAEEDLQNLLADLDTRLAELDAKVAEEFPQFAEIANPRPLALADAQALLGADEAILTHLAGGEESYLWVARRDRAEFFTIEISAEELRRAVTELRAGVDLSQVRRLRDVPAFDTQLAHELYTKLLGPPKPLLEGTRHVFLVPDGALQSLPLGVLVTEEPQGEFVDLTGYRHTQWLARKYAVTVLPSVSSLRALRVFAARTRAAKPFIGYGDPLLDGGPSGPRGIKVAGLFARGGVADVSRVRNLASLPETAAELNAMATALGAPM